MKPARKGSLQHGDRVVRDLVRIPSKVSRDVAGLGAVRKDVLRRVLGMARFAYDELLRRRHPRSGVVTVTAKVLALALPRAGHGDETTERAMKHHLQKLEALGLVETVARDASGMTKRRLYWTDRMGVTRWKRVVDRRVFGVAAVGSSELFAVPRAAQAVIEAKAATKTPGRGGARKGAGRPKGTSDGAGSKRFGRFKGGARGMSAERLIAETERCFPGSTGALGDNQKLGPVNQKKGPLYSLLLSSLLFPNYRKTTPGIASLPNGSEGAALRAASLNPSSRDESADLLPSRQGPPVVSPFTRGLPHRLIPGFVSVANRADLRVATPPPPRLDDRETPERHAFLLMRWYEGACRARFGKEPGTFKKYRGGPATSPHFDLLVTAAKAFIAEDIAPASWCSFSCDVWAKAENKGMPPLKFLFSAKRIAERAGWYRSEAESYSGGRLLYTPTAKDFIQRQSSMRCFPPALRTEAELAAHVARFFPGDAFEAHLALLRAESASLREELDRVVSLGEWVW